HLALRDLRGCQRSDPRLSAGDTPGGAGTPRAEPRTPREERGTPRAEREHPGRSPAPRTHGPAVAWSFRQGAAAPQPGSPWTHCSDSCTLSSA
ncbi:hypothetical protein Nmel_012870, partial [Mimus melanotis]